ncbi:hypothetical protein DASC09_019420 [Saccharomycopsis crataegensis]|uniref:Uncharacterized protein n=1 Tax=Saccharomycopsis crataegensis TaxID=43959 RepID=A0AAV5QII9_9ASCO|nr:hypothetical protein DASC09_019420 [Saccharomycopsis crataegensis]
MNENPDISEARYQRLVNQLENPKIFNFDWHDVDEELDYHNIREIVYSIPRIHSRPRCWYKAILSFPACSVKCFRPFPEDELTAKFVEATGFDFALSPISFEPCSQLSDYYFQRKINRLGAALDKKNDKKMRISSMPRCYCLPVESRDEWSNFSSLNTGVLSDISILLQLMFSWSFSFHSMSAGFLYENILTSVKVFPIQVTCTNISQVHLLASYGFVGIKESPTDISFSIMRQLLRFAITYKSDIVGLSDYDRLLIIKFDLGSHNGVIRYDYRLLDLKSTPISMKWAIAALAYDKIMRKDEERKVEEKKIEAFHDSLALSKEELKKIGNQRIRQIKKDQRPRPGGVWKSTNIVCTPDYLNILKTNEGKVFCMKTAEFIDYIDIKKFPVSSDIDEVMLKLVDMSELKRHHSLDEWGNFSLPYFHIVKKRSIDCFYKQIECYERIGKYNKLHPGNDERIHCPRFIGYGCGVIATRWEYASGLFFATERLEGNEAKTPEEFAKGIKEIEKLARIGIKYPSVYSEMFSIVNDEFYFVGLSTVSLEEPFDPEHDIEMYRREFVDCEF